MHSTPEARDGHVAQGEQVRAIRTPADFNAWVAMTRPRQFQQAAAA